MISRPRPWRDKDDGKTNNTRCPIANFIVQSPKGVVSF
jgi:hypothetical protein